MMNDVALKPWVYKLLPLLVWMLLLLLPILTSPANLPEPMRHHFMVHILILNSLLLLVFYAHTYLAYPLLQRKGWFIYLLATVVLFAAYWLCWYLARLGLPKPEEFMQHRLPQVKIPSGGTAFQPRPFGPRRGDPGAFIPLLSLLIAILCSFCYRILLDNAARKQLVKDREMLYLRTELGFLRSQINPHFLFNILNNLTSLARKRSEQMEPAIINLSQLMRYMLYESDDNKVPLTKEVEYLKSYVDLQMLRFGNEITLKIELDDDYSEYHIAPMLLIALVENAFKHGAEENESATILVRLKADPNTSRLYFTVINSFIKSDKQEDGAGIGLTNLRRRLAILYPQKHDLRIVNNGLIFTAQLMLEMDGN